MKDYNPTYFLCSFKNIYDFLLKYDGLTNLGSSIAMISGSISGFFELFLLLASETDSLDSLEDEDEDEDAFNGLLGWLTF